MFHLPPKTKADQLNLGFANEAPSYYSWLHNTTFMIQFDYTFGYPKNNECHAKVPFGPFPWNGAHHGGLRVEGYTAELDFDNQFRNPDKYTTVVRTPAASWFASNCRDFNQRSLLVQELIRLGDIPIHSYGGCLHNTDIPIEYKTPIGVSYASMDSSKSGIIRSYVFDLAFENTNCKEWVTEKIWQSLAAGTIPVYYGGDVEHVRKILPSPEAAIFVADFATTKELSIYLQRMALPENRREREQIHQSWRKADFNEWNPLFFREYQYSKWMNQRMNLDCFMCQTVYNIQTGELPRCEGAQPYPACE